MKQNLNLLFILFLMTTCANVCMAQINCNNFVNVSLDSNGQAVFNADMFVQGPVTWDSETVVPAMATCSDHGDTLSILVTTTTNGVVEMCTSTALIEDKMKPVPYVLTDLTLTLGANGQVTLLPSMLDAGSYDNCNFTMSVSPNVFDCSHAGQTIPVTFTVTDDAGNSDFALTNVTIVGEIPTLACNNMTIASLSIPPMGGTPSVKIYADNILEGGPYCESGSYTIQVLDSSGNEVATGIGFVTMTEEGDYTIIITQPATGNSCWGSLTIVDPLGQGCGSLACNANLTAQLGGGGMTDPVTLYVDNFLEGAYTCDITQLEITIAYNNTFTLPIVSGIGSVQMPYSGTYFYQILEPGTSNACWGELEIIGNNPCPAAIITNPLDSIGISVLGIDITMVSTILSPDNLVTHYNYTEEETRPTWTPNTCSFIAWTYADVVFDLGNGDFKIVRTFTTVDWITGDVTEFTQVIKNFIAIDYICDFLSRSTPITDCMQGHSDTDDVEWPDDLAIADHRITPVELVNFSNVDPLDASPTFYNEPTLYTTSYLDVLETLTDSTIIINRIWTVERDGLTDIEWTYGQHITVDFSDFSNLVTVVTNSNRAFPGVNINGTEVTNASGQAFVDENDPVTPTYLDSELNGLNILDLVLCRLHVLGQQVLDPIQEIAADFSQNGTVSSLDLVQMTNVIIETNGVNETDWIFLDESNQVTTEIKPRAHYKAVKLGDVNDDALIGNETEDLQEIEAHFEDKILNKGQQYTIDIKLDFDMDVLGVQMIMNLNLDNLSLIQVDGVDAFWNTTPDGRIIMTEGAAALGTDIAMKLVIRAKENGILSENLSFNTDRSSYIVNENLELLKISGTVENVITTSTHDIDQPSAKVLVYPNPASHQIRIDRSQLGIDGDLSFTLLDISGKTVLREMNPTTIQLSDLNRGMYLYQIQIDGMIQNGKLSITK